MKQFLGFRVLCLTGLVLAMFVAPGLAGPPTIVVGLKSIDELLDDADVVASAVGQQPVRENAEAAVNGITGGSGFAGIDLEKPLGAYWDITIPAPNDIGKIVAFIPISDVEQFKKLIKSHAPDFKDTDGQWTLTVGPTPLFAKISDDYCFVSASAEALANLPDPDKLVNPKYDISVDLNIGAIPKGIKSLFLQSAEEGGRKSLAEGTPPRSEAEALGQQAGFEGALSAIKSLTNDGEHVTFGLDIDSETRLVSIDFGLTSRSNSALAKSLAVYGKTTPAFGAVETEDAALRLVISHPVPLQADKAKQLIDAMRKSTDAEIDKDEDLDEAAEKTAAKDVAKRLFNIMQATVDSGTIHSVLVIDEGDDETVRFVGGLKLAKADDAGKLIDDIVKLSKASPETATLKLDVAKHAGARIHAVTPAADDKRTEKFGDGPMHLAIRADSIWIAMGGGNLESLKTALDQSAKKPSKTEAPVTLHVNPASLVTLLEDDNKALIERAEALAGESADVLNVEIAPTEGNGIKLHIVFGIDLFKLGVD